MLSIAKRCFFQVNGHKLQTLQTARATMAAAETYGLDSPVGRRLAKTAAYLERVSLDIMESAERWRTLLR
ncbi:hypothetical protein [Nonomuraea sp. NPDC002799]